MSSVCVVVVVPGNQPLVVLVVLVVEGLVGFVDVDVGFVDVDVDFVEVWELEEIGVDVVVGGPLLNLHSGVKVMSSTAMSE